MARSMPLVSALLLVSAALMVMSPQMAGALTCVNVVPFVFPCIPYARGTTEEPTASCCTGVRDLNLAAKTTADRQTACNCLKNLLNAFRDINPDNLSSIPAKCNVTVPYTISTSIDCSKVS